MGKKKKTPHKSKRIEVVRQEILSAPKTPKEALKSFAPLGQFLIGTKRHLNILRDQTHDAPTLRGFICTAAWRVITPPEVETRFAEVSQTIGNVHRLYHGTPALRIQDIVREGLQPGRRECMFGSGVYMGPPIKALSYTGYGDAKYIFMVNVALGRILEAEKSHRYTLSEIQAAGFDSVAGVAGMTSSWGGTLRYSENVVYSPDQVIIRKIFEYQQTDDPYGDVPVRRLCPIVREKENFIVAPGLRAFADVLAKGTCSRNATVQVRGEDGVPYWICTHCVRVDKLRIGSRIQIKKRGKVETIRIREVLA